MNNKKKFDICLQNPPFNNGLHEKFLIKVLNISNKVISIQPASWLLGQHKKKKITNIIDKVGADIELITAHNTFIGAAIGGNITINYVDLLNKTDISFDGKHYDKCEQISIFSSDDYLTEFYNIITKIGEYSVHDKLKTTPDNPIRSMARHKEYNPNKELYSLEIPAIRGHVIPTGKAEDFYTLFSKDDNFTNTKIVQIKNWPEFNKLENIGKSNERKILSLIYLTFKSEKECLNFINYLKTDFARGCLYLRKDGQNCVNGALSLIPWFDFSDFHFSKSPREIDNWLFKKYNISNEIRKHIEEILPDYYGIRKDDINYIKDDTLLE